MVGIVIDIGKSWTVHMYVETSFHPLECGQSSFDCFSFDSVAEGYCRCSHGILHVHPARHAHPAVPDHSARMEEVEVEIAAFIYPDVPCVEIS